MLSRLNRERSLSKIFFEIKVIGKRKNKRRDKLKKPNWLKLVRRNHYQGHLRIS
jgi:hypothetical protein